MRFVFTSSRFVSNFFTDDLSGFHASFFVSDTLAVTSVTQLSIGTEMELNIDFSDDRVIFRVHATGFAFIARFILLDAAVPFQTAAAGGRTIGMFSFDPVGDVAGLVGEAVLVFRRGVTEDGTVAALTFVDGAALVVRVSANGNSMKTTLRRTILGSNVVIHAGWEGRTSSGSDSKTQANIVIH